MRVAIVCDWLIGTGGAERVVRELHRLFPDAPIYTSVYDKNAKAWFGDNWLTGADVRTLWLQGLPKWLRKFMAPLRALAFSQLDLSNFDLVISSSGAEAKFVKTKPGTIHITYCHAPTHYYWGRYEEYLKEPGLGLLNPLARLGLRLLVKPMRRWDLRAAKRADYYLTNSEYTRRAIKRFYGRDAKVIHPPVDVERFASQAKAASQRQGFVTASRLNPYKRIDLAVEAATQLNVPLTVVGRGPDARRLRRLAGASVEFLDNTSDKDLPKIFGSAAAFIFPGADDFGIVAVEAMAAGTPVIAFAGGGALDYVNQTTGLLFNEPSVQSLTKAIADFPSHKFDHAKIAAAASQFSGQNFRDQISKFVKEVVK